MIDISTLNWIAAFIFASFASVLFLGGKKESSRTYALVALCATGWVIGLGAYFFVETPFWLVFWNRYNHVLAGLISVAFFYFSLIIPSEQRPPRWVIVLLGAVELLFLYAYFFTDIIINDSSFLLRTSLDRYQDLFYAVGPIFYAHFFGFFIAGFIALRYKFTRVTSPDVRAQLSYLLWGTAIGVIPPILADIVLPRLGIYSFYSTAGLLTLGWVAFCSYAIARHQIFNVRLVLTSVATSSIVSIAGILMVELVSGTETTFGVMGRIAIFISFFLVGVFLVYSLRKGEERRLQLETLKQRLGALNQELTTRVQERTAHLKTEQEHADRIIEHLADGLVELDSQFHVVRINPAAEKLLGTTAEEITGVIVSPQDVTRENMEALARITFPGSTTQDFTYSTKQGMRAAITEVTVSHPYERELEVATVTFGSVTTGTGYIKVIRDITAQKELSYAKSAFITTAAHKLRTPLSQIKWVFGAFLDGDLGRTTKKQAALLTKMNESNDSMIRLVNDLLNTAHLEEGRFGFSFQEIDITPVIQTIIESLSASAHEKNVTLSLTTDTLPVMSVDPDRIKEALENLIDNAIAYTKPGGTVSVHATATNQQVTITVTDSGIGIAPDELDKVFKKFYRGQEARVLRKEGSGLGLFIVQSIIRGHGGTVDISSEPGVGTTATVSLPTQISRQ